MNKISLESNKFPGNFIAAVGTFVRILSPNDSDLRKQCTFTWTGPDLHIGETGSLLPSATGGVLHIAPETFKIDVESEQSPPEEESTFVLEQGLADGNQFSFRSVKFSDRFILRSRNNNEFFAKPVNTPDERPFATFGIVPPLDRFD